ncbi:hypothetical protein PDESU_03658 [Pontiella desulfatans]|uniref:Uncharacterized protein n=2 Tax=Pontiella desulfatans TaxID=2750659 RepID=A0A6C2U4T7_PONDE|nr:hypothetical protein PDESU_03658 [Pontiella desulfatans]
MSPARLETATRLLGGDAAVWLLFRGKYPEENRAVRDLLDEELSALGKSIVYNEDFLQLAKEAGVEVPALMFSVLEVDPDDPQEAVLMAILTRLFPEAAAQSGPVVVPVFGQGRGAVLMMDELIAGEYIRDVAEFLIGACSCEVKELNPGFDLFIPVDWIGGITQEYVFDAELPPLTSPSAGMGALPGAANRTFGTAEQAGHRLFGAVLGISIVIVLGGLVGATWMLLRKNRNHESF